MQRLFPSIVCVVVLLFSAASEAHQFPDPGTQVWHNDTLGDCASQGACGAIAEQAQNSCPSPPNTTDHSASVQDFGGGLYQLNVTAKCNGNNNGVFVWTWNGTGADPDCDPNRTDGEDLCAPPPAQCDQSITGQAFLRPAYSANEKGDICHESSQCVMTAVNVTDLGTAAALVEFQGTGNSCGAEPEIPITPQNQQEQCISVMGNTFCTEPDLADQNCGYFNDEYLCLDDVPDGDCTFYGNGDMACATNATSPPAPDDGITPGVAAPPDASINVNGNTTNIYNNNTVGGSSGDPAGTKQNDPMDQEAIELDLSEIIETEPPADQYDDSIEGILTTDEAALDGVTTELADPNDFGGDTTIDDTIGNAFGIDTSCSDIVIGIGGNNVTLACADVADTRAVLGWIARIAFLLAMFDLVTRRPI